MVFLFHSLYHYRTDCFVIGPIPLLSILPCIAVVEQFPPWLHSFGNLSSGDDDVNDDVNNDDDDDDDDDDDER